MNILEDLAIKYGTDKQIKNGHGYTKYYHEYFNNIRLNKLNVLELGVREGWSLRMWHKYFVNSLICGIDNNLENKCPGNFIEDRILFKIGSQDDSDFLLNLSNDVNNFDIIIDDASHISPLTIKSFEILFPVLKSGGIYVIEDLHVCDIVDPYLPYGLSTITYLSNINKTQLNILDIKFYDNKIAFILKK